jgi:23S rRNA pseudouridine2605 synthase
MIAAGRVEVNGRLVDTQGVLVDPRRDEIRVDGRVVGQETERVYYALHKPVGVVSAAYDPSGRPVVTDLVPDEVRVYPVGRLDADSEGLILLTNDGELALRLTHPRFEIEKEYHALVDGVPGPAALEQLRRGVILDDGWTLPAQASVLGTRPGRSWLRVVLREGRKRQVRRMLAAVGHQVRRLVRVRIGDVELGDLPPGAWRPLTGREVAVLWGTSR